MDRMAHVDVDQSTVKPHSFQTLSKVFFLQERHAFLKISRQILVRHRNKWNNSSKNSDPECLLLFHPGGQSCLVEKNHSSHGFCSQRSWWFFSVSIKTPPTKFQVSTGLSWSALYLPESQRGTFPVFFFFSDGARYWICMGWRVWLPWDVHRFTRTKSKCWRRVVVMVVSG